MRGDVEMIQKKPSRAVGVGADQGAECLVGLDAMYLEIIREHSKDPRGFADVTGAALKAEGYNPLCGDRVEVGIELSGDKVKSCQFNGEGCSICMASASMMTEEVEGRPVSEALAVVQEFRDLLQGKREELSSESDLAALKGVRRFSVRIKCALLPWIALRDALAKKEAA